MEGLETTRLQVSPVEMDRYVDRDTVVIINGVGFSLSNILYRYLTGPGRIFVAGQEIYVDLILKKISHKNLTEHYEFTFRGNGFVIDVMGGPGDVLGFIVINKVIFSPYEAMAYLERFPFNLTLGARLPTTAQLLLEIRQRVGIRVIASISYQVFF